MEHPPIGFVQPWGEPVWAGWFMIAALFYSAAPAVLLGRMKIPLAHALHDKALYADAQMNKADWLSGAAGIAGIIGIGLGLWWADAVAATVISLDIAHDGWSNLRVAVSDLMDARPTLVDHSAPDPLPARMRTELLSMDWVADARVRLRDEGHVFFGEAEIVPSDDRDLVQRLDEARRTLMQLDWRIYHMVLMPVRSLSAEPEAED
jgi:divalent metal cation (Fe/Co/Zn/Cd) transporter